MDRRYIEKNRIKPGMKVFNTASGAHATVVGEPYSLPRAGGAQMINYIDVELVKPNGGSFKRQWRLASVQKLEGGAHGKARN
jgi:hypothetical protein